MKTKYPIVVSQRVPFPVLFPKVAGMVEICLMVKFKFLQCDFLKGLLSHCVENLTREIVSLSENFNQANHSNLHKNQQSTIPYLTLSNVYGIDGNRIKEFVNDWYDSVTMFNDKQITKIVYPKIYEFVKKEVMSRGQIHFSVSDSDTSNITMLLIKETNVFFKRNRGHNSDIAKTYGQWFAKI